MKPQTLSTEQIQSLDELLTMIDNLVDENTPREFYKKLDMDDLTTLQDAITSIRTQGEKLYGKKDLIIRKIKQANG